MGNETKEKILDTAFRLFVDNSYEGVTIDEIAEETCVSKGAVFHYFDSKFELANSSIFYYMENNWMPIYEDILKSEEPDQMLKKSIDYSFDFFHDNPKFMRFFMELYERSKNEDIIEEQIDNFYKELLEMGTMMFERLDVENPKIKAHLLTACLDGLALQFTFFGDEEDFPDQDELKDETYRIFISGENQ